MTLYEWALKHHVGMDALTELRAMWGDVDNFGIEYREIDGSEELLQSQVVLEGAAKGVRLYRNNVGALKDTTGRLVRYGLANNSKYRNKVIKSGDLIGIRPILITGGHVGQTIGQFVSRECKRPSWHMGQDPGREGPQLAWAQLVLSLGGDAKFCNAVGSL